MRRGLVVLAAFVACSHSSSSGDDLPSEVAFPKGFVWGTATAAFQIETGSAHSDWATWVTLPGKIKNGDTPDGRMPDALAHVDDDIALMKKDGHTGYRLSVDWARLYPTRAAFDADQPDPAAVAAYDGLLTKLKSAGIAPMVTLMHFVTPDYLADATKPNDPQSFERAEMPDLFGQFCARVAKRWGALVDLWATINEPVVVPLAGYVQGSFPPGVVLDTQRAFAYAMGEASGHAKCFDAVHANDTADADGDGKPALVGPVAHQRVVEPADPSDPDDVAATEHIRYINNLWFLNAVVKGDVDTDVDGKVDGPNDRTADPALLHRADFLGINYYSALVVSAHSGIVLPAPVNAAITPDHLATDRPKTDFLWDIVPTGIVTVLEEAKDYGLPIYVTENGLADAADANRPRFLAEHLYQLGIAIQEKHIDVRGYFHWSLFDNFEWANGFCPKFGLYAIDPATHARVARKSAALYARLIAAGKVTRADVDATAAYVPPSVRCE